MTVQKEKFKYIRVKISLKLHLKFTVQYCEKLLFCSLHSICMLFSIMHLKYE